MKRKMFFLFFGVVFFAFSLSIFSQEPLKNPKTKKMALPQGIGGDWLAKVQKNIEKEEYNLSNAKTESGALYQAPNTANSFRTYFYECGIKIIPTNDEN
ncbi:MAG: hypothetical protein N2445_07545, partial [Acidobacteria bacterium]|nr:hypothetical protein [Acidobacteriota bacterium]